jgi:hypothetical protein
MFHFRLPAYFFRLHIPNALIMKYKAKGKYDSFFMKIGTNESRNVAFNDMKKLKVNFKILSNIKNVFLLNTEYKEQIIPLNY